MPDREIHVNSTPFSLTSEEGLQVVESVVTCRVSLNRLRHRSLINARRRRTVEALIRAVDDDQIVALAVHC